MPVDRATWVRMMIEAAKPTAEKIGVSPEAIVAQASLESGWGQRKVGAHNLFGIKADSSWTGKRVVVRTREVYGGKEVMVDDAFRDYDSDAESIADHFAFLDRNSRYRAAGVFDGKGDVAYFEALQRAGYATDPNYASVLTAVLHTVQAIAGSSPAAIQPRTLMIGMSGDDVAALQRALNEKCDAMLDADGVFGSTTMLAVRHAQEAAGLQVDGIVGPATRAALGLA